MPYFAWGHDCAQEGRDVSRAERICSRCGAEGRPLRWSYGMHEDMARFQTLYRVKPIGPHRKMTDRLFELTTTCGVCSGAYLFGGEEGWAACPGCHGLGRRYAVSFAEVEKVRQEILDVWPDAAADPVQGFPGGVVVQSLRSGSMLGQRAPMSSASLSVVFQWWSGAGYVLLREPDWRRFSRIDAALQRARTWGELEQAMPEGEFETLTHWYANDGQYVYEVGGVVRFCTREDDSSQVQHEEEFVIRSDDPLDPCSVHGYADGDYPPWIPNMLEPGDLPRGFAESFGEGVGSPAAGAWWEFRESALSEMTRVLAGSGYMVWVCRGVPGEGAEVERLA